MSRPYGTPLNLEHRRKHAVPVSPWDELGIWAAVIGHYFEVMFKPKK